MNILIADDHTLFREMCEEYITRKRPDANILTVKNFNDALELMEQSENISLIILDLCMPGMDGTCGITKMCKKYPDIPVAVISGVAKKCDVDACIKAGARGFFPKTLSGRALISAIELVVNGEKFIPADYKDPPELKHSSDIDYQDLEENLKARGIHLTRREKEILGFLAKGCSNQEIADSLGLQLVTIKLHVRGACQKLGVKNRTQAALMAKEFGIIAC